MPAMRWVGQAIPIHGSKWQLSRVVRLWHECPSWAVSRANTPCCKSSGWSWSAKEWRIVIIVGGVIYYFLRNVVGTSENKRWKEFYLSTEVGYMWEILSHGWRICSKITLVTPWSSQCCFPRSCSGRVGTLFNYFRSRSGMITAAQYSV